MKFKNVLVTGAAGFIGYHLSKRLLKNGCIVTGIDNLNSYYDVSLKEARLQRLRHFESFSFFKMDISHKEAMEKIYTCTLCSRCETLCHVDIDFHKYWEEIRKWLVENGISPPENTITMYDNIANEEYKNPFMEPLPKRDEWYRDEYELPKKADIIYFIGCMTSYH